MKFENAGRKVGCEICSRHIDIERSLRGLEVTEVGQTEAACAIAQLPAVKATFADTPSP